jgi:hypothetical protein
MSFNYIRFLSMRLVIETDSVDDGHARDWTKHLLKASVLIKNITRGICTSAISSFAFVGARSAAQ